MRSIYQAGDGIDAQRVVDVLAFAGIAAHIHGAALSGGVGELPAGSFVSVWVADGDVDAALAALADDARHPHALLPDADDLADAAVRPAPASRGRWSAVVFALVAGLCVGYVLAYAQIAGRAPVDGPVDCREGRP